MLMITVNLRQHMTGYLVARVSMERGEDIWGK